MVRWFSLLLTVGLSVLGGCNDSCEIGGWRCIDGDQLEGCGYNEREQSNQIERVSCASLNNQVCFQPTGAVYANCVSSSTPCDPATFQGACVGNQFRIVCDQQIFPEVAMAYPHPELDFTCPGGGAH